MSRFNPVDKLNSPPCAARTDRGMALVFVLAIIVLIAGLVVAYLLTATHAMQTAAIYKNDVATQQLADTAVNVVIGQIADGTHTARQGSPDEGLVWTSQPGLIRTYGTDGKPYRFYKLYSSADMVVRNFPKDYWSPEENVKTEVPNDWYEHRGLFSDLNEPSLLALDPSAGATSLNLEGAILINGARYYAYYPIVDPTAQLPTEPGSRDGVEGFAIDARRLSSAPSGAPPAGYNPTRVTDPRHSPNPAPMPVRWLYVLRDGQLTAPESSSRGASGAEEVSWTPDNPSAPTRDNPIVGRIAFWADDETCKLNINTASEGTFWDRSILLSYENSPPEELKLFYGKPRSDEWQRTPGHPAMTCLSPVFGMLPDFRVPLSVPYPASAYSKFAAIYNLVPRVGTGGSLAGTWTPSHLDYPGPIKSDQDRLFASPDELLFAPSKRGDTSRQVANPQITRSFLEKAKFFLTTSNRAPETNLFNRPRISLWPVQQEVDPNNGRPGCPKRPRSTQDDKLAACATLKGQPYFFQRYSAYLIDAINDQYKHPDEPFGQQTDHGYAPPSSQRAALDWNIPRNHQLYRYLQDMTDRPIPGLEGRMKFSDKLGADRDQLLTTMVDLLRTANDLKPSTTTPASYSYSPAMPQGSSVDPAGLGQIVPLMPPPGTPGEGTKGLGRFPTIAEAVLVVFRVKMGDPKIEDKLGTLLLLQAFSPNIGQPKWGPLARVCIRGLDAFSINGQSLDMPPVATNLFAQGITCLHNAMAFTCSAGTYRTLTLDPATKELATKTVGTNNEADNYPFYSPIFLPVPKNGQNLAFSGGSLTVEIHAGFYGKPGSCLVAPPRESLVQTLQLDFPATTLPVPINAALPMDKLLIANFGLIFQDSPGTPDMFRGQTRRGIQVDPNGPTHGDLRLLAALPTVPANYFHPHPDYFSSKLTAHSMRSYGLYLTGASDRVELEPGVVYPFGIAANGLHGALLSGTSWLGDWDSGGGREFADGGQYWHPDQADGPLLENHTSAWSPLRQLPSPVIFGSLPIGVNPKDPKPWRTLLFCANPASGNHHPGWQQPRDHYLLDLFQMPVVEPYAISAPLATAGKVNLNCQIAPFTYIRRDTALRGAFRGTKVTTLDNQKVQRLNIDANETLKGFQRRFADKGGSFKTASELCEMFLVPEGAKLEDMKDGDPDKWWWKSYRATGDNLRESPYGNLYSRVTARSDTFTVHYRVQVLTHNAAAHPNVWNEGSDSIASDARGSALLERYVDPDDPRLRDFATDRNATLDECYKFRVIRVQRFGR